VDFRRSPRKVDPKLALQNARIIAGLGTDGIWSIFL